MQQLKPIQQRTEEIHALRKTALIRIDALRKEVNPWHGGFDTFWPHIERVEERVLAIEKLPCPEKISALATIVLMALAVLERNLPEVS